MDPPRVDAPLVRYRRKCTHKFSLTTGRRPYPTTRPKISLTCFKPNQRLLCSLCAPKCPNSDSASSGASCSAPIKCLSSAHSDSVPCQPAPKKCCRRNSEYASVHKTRASTSVVSLQVPRQLKFSSKNCPQRVALVIEGRRVEYKRKDPRDCKQTGGCPPKWRKDSFAPCSSDQASTKRRVQARCNRRAQEFDLSVDWAREALKKYAEKRRKDEKEQASDSGDCCSRRSHSADYDPLALNRKEKRTRLQARQTTDKIQELKCAMSTWRREFNAALNELQKMVKPSVKKYEILDKLQIPEELVAYAYGCQIDDFIL